MGSRIFALIFLAVMLAAAGLVLYPLVSGAAELPAGGDLAESFEVYLQENLPGKQQLADLRLEIEWLNGRREFNGVFISGGKLIHNYQPPERDNVVVNMQGIHDVIREGAAPVFLLLTPSACAIYQRELPQNAPLFNQKELIDNMYRSFSGTAGVVDGYSVLFANSGEYLYYNTHRNLTSHGGYYLYEAICRRLGKTARSKDEFNVQYAGYGFYGDIYEILPYDGAESDTVALYRYTGSRRENQYTVTHRTGTETYTYDRLYIPEMETGDDRTDIIFGGLSAVTEIRTDSVYDENLLVFGDETVKSFLPFLANHYSRITVVSLTELTTQLAEKISLTDYSQILFAYSIETFLEQDLSFGLAELLSGRAS